MGFRTHNRPAGAPACRHSGEQCGHGYLAWCVSLSDLLFRGEISQGAQQLTQTLGVEPPVFDPVAALGHALQLSLDSAAQRVPKSGVADVHIPKPIPTSFAKESFFAASAFKFSNAVGVSRHGRYRVQPVGGNEYLSDTEAAARDPNFLFDEIKERIAKEPVTFRVAAQLAEDGDTVDDATIRWPDGRPEQAFGEICLRDIDAENAHEQQQIISDPIPRVDGIEPSAEPLFGQRANIYLMSGRRRRAAG